MTDPTITPAAPFVPSLEQFNTAPPSQDVNEQFLTLLVKQLQNQDPLNPRDGAEFMQELVSLSTLSELVTMRKVLEANFAPEGTSGGAASSLTDPNPPREDK